MQDLHQFFFKCIFVILATSLALTSARHLGQDTMDDSNQLTDIETNQLGSGLKPWQMEMLAQRLAMAELQSNNQYYYPEYNLRESVPQDLLLEEFLNYPGKFQRQIRGERRGELRDEKNGKRANRCFFNAVSCFGKK